MSDILVTGGLGFIGSNFIRYIPNSTDTSPSIVNLDSVSYGANTQNLSDIDTSAGYRFVRGDTTDKDLVERLINEAELVVHFAAETHVDRSISAPESFLHSNVLGTFTLLEACRKGKVRRFVHISTDEVYGSTDASFTEEDRLQPSSPYAASKAAADLLVEAYHLTYGLDTVTLRCTNNFGFYQFPEKFIPKTIINTLLGRRIPIYGSGKQVRDWIYVLDFCKAVKLAMEKGKSGTIYNVSAGNEIPNIEVANLIVRRLNKPGELMHFVEDRPAHDFRYSLDSSRIRAELGWKPDYSFRDALERTIDWYSENQSWWRPLITEEILSPSPWKEKW